MSAPARLQEHDETVRYRCRKCPGLILTEDQLTEHRTYHILRKALMREAQRIVEEAGQLDRDGMEGKKGQPAGTVMKSGKKKKVAIRKLAVARQKVLAEKREKLEKARKKAEQAKARKERAARTMALIKERVSATQATSKENQNLGEKQESESSVSDLGSNQNGPETQGAPRRVYLPRSCKM